MSWSELLRREVDSTYGVTDALLGMVDGGALDWKPQTGSNWMTTGQLLMHISNGCGAAMKGFVTGDWGMPEGVDMSELPEDEMLPSADKMPTIASVPEARRLLAEDKKIAAEMLAQCSEQRLANDIATAPWDTTEMILGHRLLQMVEHLKAHKAQLYYYLKLQGKPVNTGHLWGM